MGLETLSSKKKILTAELISHIFGETRFFAKSRVGSEGVTGLKTRGRPPRLDDTLRFKYFCPTLACTTPFVADIPWPRFCTCPLATICRRCSFGRAFALAPSRRFVADVLLAAPSRLPPRDNSSPILAAPSRLPSRRYVADIL
jgi:hypothetical protein